MDSLTPQEQAELESRMKAAGLKDPRAISSINERTRSAVMSSPEADAAEPSWDPLDLMPNPKLAIGAAEGAIKAAPRAAGSLADFFIRKGTGLGEKTFQAAMEHPGLVKGFRGATELEAQNMAKGALSSAGEGLSSRAKDLDTTLQSQLAGKFIPDSRVSSVNAFQKLPSDPATGMLAAQDAQKALRDIGNKQTSWSFDPINKSFKVATDPEAGAAYGTLRGAIREAAPESHSTVDRLREGIDAQKALNAGNEAPLSFMGSEGDIAASRQRVDSLVPNSNLEGTAQSYKAAQQLNKEPKTLLDKFIVKPVATAGLAVRQAAQPITNAADKVGSGLAQLIGRGAMAGANSSIPVEAKPTAAPDDLTPAEMQELRLRMAR